MSDEWDGQDRRSGLFNKEFYDNMMEMHSDMKHIRRWIEDHKSEDDARHAKIDERLKVIENDRAKIYGGASVLGIVGGLLTKWFLK